MSKRIFSSVSLTSLMLCAGMLGWSYSSLSSTSVVNWGSGELWASGGKLVMMDQSVNPSPETKFTIRSMDHQAQPAVLTASLQSATLGYHSVPANNGVTIRNLVLPMWALAAAFALLPFASILRHHAKKKKAKEQAKH
jgi:hypothetical protein